MELTEHQKNVAALVAAEMCEWKPEDRVAFLQRLAAEFCPDCGRRLAPAERCHCENEE